MLRVDTLRAQKRGPITAGENFETTYSKPRISRIRVDRKIHPTYAKIRLMRSEIKGFGAIAPEILSEIWEDPTYANPTYARFTVHVCVSLTTVIRDRIYSFHDGFSGRRFILQHTHA